MTKTIHPNFIKSSNLILIMVGLGLINMFLTSEYLTSGKQITISIGSLLFIAALAYFVRQGKSWMKYVLLVLTIIGLLVDPRPLNHFIPDSIFAGIGLVQALLQIVATVLLFLVPAENSSDKIIDSEV
ncbi:MAG: hypothetical protein JWM14_2483 [Chitinophagaceae bacterium]|nr:hypothetical protein [Chitinophagaceae bacterium]